MTNMKDIERDIVKNEMMEIAKVMAPIKRAIKDDEKRAKVINAVMKLAKKEGLDMDSYALEDFLLDSLEDILSEDVEYVPGYADEYVDKIKEMFYSEKGINVSKLAQYILDKFFE